MSLFSPRSLLKAAMLVRHFPWFTKLSLKDLQYLLAQEPQRVRWLVDYSELRLGGALSYAQKRPLQPDGEAIPWYTYPAIEYLSQIDFSSASIFEFGSGNSSAWWSTKAKEVFSVESDPDWHAEVAARTKSNQTLLLQTNKSAYATAFLNLSKRFDVFVIDGDHRRVCAEAVIKHRAPESVVILDNSDWFPLTCERLTSSGLQQIDFIGPGPINCYAWATSIFVPYVPNILGKRSYEQLSVTAGLRQVDVNDSESTLD